MHPTEEFCSVCDGGAKPAARCLCSSNQNMTWSVTRFQDTFVNVFVTNHLFMSYLIILNINHDYHTTCFYLSLSKTLISE
jgi:hypothetical protein